ncbi:MAG TPA: HTTM domain-containing protein [Polyangiaceae bacterium]|nr:HTTM domain-containing protein [Polyangiaceae bacterium]
MIERMRALGVTLRSPVDSAWLAAFRVLFGLTLLISTLRFLAYGWIDQLFVAPKFHFKYWGFSWVKGPPEAELHALYWLLAALCVGVCLGLCFRLAAFGSFVCFSYLQLLDVTIYLNHYYLASLLSLLLLCSPAGQTYSLDALLRPRTARRTVPRAWLYLFRFQVAVVYTFAGLHKAHGDWLFHAEPLRIWLLSRADTPLLGPIVAQDWAAPLMGWAGFLFDTSSPWLLMTARLRPFAYALVIVFHCITGLLFPIGMFPVIMVLSALVFFSTSWPRKLWACLPARLRAHCAAANAPPAVPLVAPFSTRYRLWFALGAAYCLFQVAFPLRFLAYGGCVRWHEQGMRFSWRVMIREKNGSITFVVRAPAAGRTFYVAPHQYLTRLQEREMSSQPDLILQLAHRIRDDYAAKGIGPVEVRADTWVSLNGRPIQRLIDPNIDLARVEDGLGKADWILPEPSAPPPRLHAIRS